MQEELKGPNGFLARCSGGVGADKRNTVTFEVPARNDCIHSSKYQHRNELCRILSWIANFTQAIY